MFANQHKLTGRLTIDIYDALNQNHETKVVNNLITRTGKETLAKYFINNITSALGFYIGVGTGTTAAAEANTALETQQEEVAATVTFIEDATKPVTLRVSAAVPPLATGAAAQPLTEAGILLNISGQATKALYNRVTFAAINRTEATTLNFAWDISF